MPVEWKKKNIQADQEDQNNQGTTNRFNRKVTRGSEDWLTIQRFETTTKCIESLRSERRQIWVTDLSMKAEPLIASSEASSEFPTKMALVIGREADGVSNEMLEAADKRVYLPIYGFSESLNLSVATAMILQQLFVMCPSARGDLSDEEKRNLRVDWYQKLAKNSHQMQIFPLYIDHPPPPFQDLRRLEKHRIPYVKSKIRNRVLVKEQQLVQNFPPNEHCVSEPSVNTG